MSLTPNSKPDRFPHKSIIRWNSCWCEVPPSVAAHTDVILNPRQIIGEMSTWRAEQQCCLLKSRMLCFLCTFGYFCTFRPRKGNPPLGKAGLLPFCYIDLTRKSSLGTGIPLQKKKIAGKVSPPCALDNVTEAPKTDSSNSDARVWVWDP